MTLKIEVMAAENLVLPLQEEINGKIFYIVIFHNITARLFPPKKNIFKNLTVPSGISHNNEVSPRSPSSGENSQIRSPS